MSSIQPDPIPGPRGGTPPEAKGEHEAVPIDRIVVPDGRRPPRNLPALAESIAAVGLLNPITLTPDHRLIAGRNRLEACRSLGWTHIPAVVLKLDRLHAELAEIDENLIRNELSALERCEQTERRKDVYEAIHPETRSVNVKGGPGRGHKKAEKTAIETTAVLIADVLEEPPVRSFAADQAAKTGQAEVTVRREVQIAGAIPAALRDRIRDTPLADRKDDLLKLARLDPGLQEAVVDRILADPKLTIPQAIGRVRQAEKLAELEAKARAVASAPSDGTKPSWEIREGDCVEVLATVEPGSVRLIFLDPPYNEFEAASRVLTEDGSIWVLTSSRWGGRTQCLLEDLGLHYRETIIWNEAFGVHCEGTFGKDHRPLYRFTKHASRQVFHPDRVPSSRQTTYDDPRANPAGRVPSNVWRFPRVCGTHAERQPGFPTQIPLDLLRAVVSCASDPGDLVLDPFSGSATTGVAAIELGRRYLGIERSSEFAHWARQRLRDTKGSDTASVVDEVLDAAADAGDEAIGSTIVDPKF